MRGGIVISEAFVTSKKILILDNSIDEKNYSPISHWSPFLYHPIEVFRASRGELPHGVLQYSHIIITGSEASIVDTTDWLLREEELVCIAVDNDKAILGSCFGHQLIARALFGKDRVRRRERPDIGWSPIKIVVDDYLAGKGGDVQRSFNYHFDEVCNLPADETVVLAHSDECEVEAFRIKGKPVWGIQSHPEIGIGEALRLVDGIRKPGLPCSRDFISGEFPQPKDTGWIVRIMREFQKL